MRPVKFSVVLDWLKSEGFVSGDTALGSVPDFEIEGFASVDLAGPADASFWVGDTVKNETNANGFASSLLGKIHAGPPVREMFPECAAWSRSNTLTTRWSASLKNLRLNLLARRLSLCPPACMRAP